MRIISGSSRGRKLIPIKGDRIRPTSDRAREDIFNIIGQGIRHARVLDCFAGTGALGIEALSRGAAKALFIDIDCTVIHKNIRLCRFEDKAVVLNMDIIRSPFPHNLAMKKFDFVFLDPPYGKGYIEKILDKKQFIDLMAPDAIIIAEHGSKENLQIQVPGLDIFRQKKYSNTIISFIRQAVTE
jgi:16S rRNA (guanine966-N2)-methyltransferase